MIAVKTAKSFRGLLFCRTLYTVSEKNCASVIFWITPWNIGQFMACNSMKKWWIINDWSFAHLTWILLLHYLVKCRSWILAVYNNELIQAVHASSKKIIVRSQNFWQSVIYLVKSSARLIFLRKFFKKPL